MILRVKEELYTFLLAIQFLTRLPIDSSNIYSETRAAAGPRYYAVVGLAIGGVAASIFWFAAQYFGALLAALLSTAGTLLLTGAFHEDGLADTFDGVGGATDRQRTLEIMKDSRIGVYGAASLMMMLSLKIAAIAKLQPEVAAIALVAAHCLSRVSSVVVIATSRYVRDSGAGKATADGVDSVSLFVAALTGVACLFGVYIGISSAAAFFIFGALIVGHLLSRGIFERRIGGYTGDCLGATQQVTEVAIYLALLL